MHVAVSAVNIKDERGTTLVELMVGLAAGMIVLAALSMVLITTMRGTARVSARVDATQRARVVLTQITEQLHSACLKPEIAPILSDSTGTRLSFVRPTSGTVAAVAPTPQKSVVSFANGTLTERNYDYVAGTLPWEFNEAKASSEQQLLTKVAPLTTAGPIFTYYKFLEGAPKEVESALIKTESLSIVEVRVALNATPMTTPVADQGADTSIENSAVLRLTPPPFPQTSTAPPCT